MSIPDLSVNVLNEAQIPIAPLLWIAQGEEQERSVRFDSAPLDSDEDAARHDEMANGDFWQNWFGIL